MVAEADFDTLPPEQDPRETSGVMAPPSTLSGVLQKLGPGLIIAGSIVGSGELIATTKTGAQAGILLLWLIIIGCVIKVFVQIELGRYTITHGETTLAALDQVPGPRLHVNWIIWFWLAMMVIGFGQLGGIVGGVGQAAAIAVPIRGDYLAAVERPSQKEVERLSALGGRPRSRRRELGRAAARPARAGVLRRPRAVRRRGSSDCSRTHGDLAAPRARRQKCCRSADLGRQDLGGRGHPAHDGACSIAAATA